MGGQTWLSSAAPIRAEEHAQKKDYYWRQSRALEYGLESDTYSDAMDIAPVEDYTPSEFDTDSDDEAVLHAVQDRNDDNAPVVDQPQAQGLRRRRV